MMQQAGYIYYLILEVVILLRMNFQHSLTWVALPLCLHHAWISLAFHAKNWNASFLQQFLAGVNGDLEICFLFGHLTAAVFAAEVKVATVIFSPIDPTPNTVTLFHVLQET